MHVVVVGEHADEDDRAGHCEGHPEHEAPRPFPPERVRDEGAEPRRDGALGDRARNCHPPHRQQLFDVELQPDAEHQEDDSDLRQLLGQRTVRDEPWRMWPDERAGQKVADDRRQADATGDVAEQEGSGQPSP